MQVGAGRRFSLAATTVVYRDWSEETADVASRMLLVERVLDELERTRFDVDLLMLPAGFLAAKNKRAADHLAAGLVGLAKARAAVLFGVDVHPRSRTRKEGKESGDGGALCYLARFDGRPSPLWGTPQLATTSRDRVSASDVPTDRVLNLGDWRVGVLICGEMMAKVRARKFRRIVDDADVVLDIAHRDVRLGRRSDRTWFTALHDTAVAPGRRRPVVMVHHVRADALERRLETLSTVGEPKRLATDVSTWRRRLVLNDGERDRHPPAYVDIYDLPPPQRQ